MEKTCVDAVFGEMTYKHRWYKTQSESFFGREYVIKIAAKAYSEKPITDEQRDGYRQYTEKKDEYAKIVGEQLMRYVNANLQELAGEWVGARRVENITDLAGIVTPKTLLFKQDGTTLLLLECAWDMENGIAVKLSPEIMTGSQNLFL